MPVYLRKNTKFTPDSLQNFNPVEDDDEDFIQDPDLFVDKLPQPYRLIDKICDSIVEAAWDIIVQRETQRNVEASKIRPPKYTTDIQVEVHGPSRILCNNPNGEYVFVGKPDGLSVINAITQETIDEWKDEKMDIVDVVVYCIDENHHLITTIDDMGIGRLFLFSEDNIYLMYAFNEPSSPGDNIVSADINKKDKGQTQAASMMGSTKKEKPIVTKCEASSKGDYIGVCFQNAQTQENWLEFYKVNKESLLKEIESANSKFAKKPETEGDNVAEGETTGDDGATEPPADSQPNSSRTEASDGRTDLSSRNSLSSRSYRRDVDAEGGEKKESPNSQKSGDKKSQKFTSPQLVLKVKPPQPMVGANFATPFAAQKSIDDTGDVLGTGTKHLLSGYHIEMKKAVFEHMHEDQLQYLPKDKKPAVLEPTFHFLNPGRLLPQGLEQSALQGQPTTVAVWWEGQYQVMVYSLIKQGKASKSGRSNTKLSERRSNTPRKSPLLTPVPPYIDVEHKPDMVLPMSSTILYSTVTRDCSLLAIGLSNNNVVVWDLQLGMVRRILHVSDIGSIFKLHFLDPSLFDDSKVPTLGGNRPYKLGTNSYLLVIFNDGQMYKITCGLNDTTLPERISPSLEEWESYTVVEPMQAIPELAVTCRKNGQVFLEDVTNGSIVLEICVPIPFSVFTPWQPVFAIGGKGTILYIKGHSQTSGSGSNEGSVDGTEGAAVEGIQSLFVFKLRSVPTLDSYRRKKRNDRNTYAVHPTIEDRSQAIMKERISQQGLRTSRMQQRWTQLKEELDLIRDLREKSLTKGAPRSAYSESTIVRTPALDFVSKASGEYKSP